MRAMTRRSQYANYEGIVAFTCVLRMLFLAVALWQGSFFVIKNATLYYTLVPFLNALNLFQMVFMLNVLQTKNIFQFRLYIPIVAYSLVLIALMIQEAFRESGVEGKGRIAVARAFLIAYAAEQALEIILCLSLYRRLKADFLWSTFKRVGVSTEVNGKLSCFNFRGIES
jgi:hypothetical protein